MEARRLITAVVLIFTAPFLSGCGENPNFTRGLAEAASQFTATTQGPAGGGVGGVPGDNGGSNGGSSSGGGSNGGSSSGGGSNGGSSSGGGSNGGSSSGGGSNGGSSSGGGVSCNPNAETTYVFYGFNLPPAGLPFRLPVLAAGQANHRKHDIPYVKDAQVLFGFDLAQIAKAGSINEVESAVLHLSVIKHGRARDHENPGEVLCLVGPQICSGELESGRRVLNRDFWQDADLANSYFAEQDLSVVFGPNAPSVRDRYERDGHELDREHGDSRDRSNGITLLAGEMSLDLDRLLERSSIQTVDLLSKQPRLTIVIGDDTYVAQRPRLELKLKQNLCDDQEHDRPGR